MGYSRDTFYRVKKAYENGGMEALKEKSRRTPNIKNRVSDEVEQAVVALALEELAFGQKRAADTLRQRGMFISPAGVRCVWLRHRLETFAKRLQRLEEHVAKTGEVLTEAQLRAMAKATSTGDTRMTTYFLLCPPPCRTRCALRQLRALTHPGNLSTGCPRRARPRPGRRSRRR